MGNQIRRRRRQLGLAAAMLLLVQLGAAESAYTKNRSANAMIDRAIDEHYFVTDFDEAEALLLAVLRACGEKCSPQTFARAWMYVGVVRIAGKQQPEQARAAFELARAHDPDVALDEELATEAARALWREVDAVRSAAPDESRATDQPALLTCMPEPSEARSGYRLPVSCRMTHPKRSKRPQSMVLHYLEFGESSWQELELSERGEQFEGLLPCSATAYPGPLNYFVTFRDRGGETRDALGSRSTPRTVNVSADSRVIHRMAGGRPAPRCDAKPLCPPGFPCADRDQACLSDEDCKQGLVCAAEGSERICQPPRRREPDARLRHRMGVQAALDVLSLRGQTGLCSADRQQAPERVYHCYLGESRYPDAVGAPVPGAAGKLEGGLAPGTWRVAAYYAVDLGEMYALGARAGVVLGTRAHARVVPHLELLIKRYVTSRESVLRPFVGLSGGWGPGQARKQLTVSDQNHETGEISRLEVSAIAQSDPYFVAFELGAELTLTGRLRVMAGVGAPLTLPELRPGLRPTLGAMVAF